MGWKSTKLMRKFVYLTDTIGVRSKNAYRQTTGRRRCFETLKVTNSIFVLKFRLSEFRCGTDWWHFFVRHYHFFDESCLTLDKLNIATRPHKWSVHNLNRGVHLICEVLQRWKYTEQYAPYLILTHISSQIRKILINTLSLKSVSLTLNK